MNITNNNTDVESNGQMSKFSKQENRDSERLNDLLKVIQLVNIWLN